MDNDELRRMRSLIAAEALDEIGTDRYDIARLTGLAPGEVALMLANRDKEMELAHEREKVLKKECSNLLGHVEWLEHELERVKSELDRKC